MQIDTNQRALLKALTGVFGGNKNRALQTVELLAPEAISQIDTQAGSNDFTLAVISKGGFAAPQAFASRGRVGVIVESEGGPQLGEVFTDDDKIGLIVVEILQGKLTKPEEVQPRIEALFEDQQSKADAWRAFQILFQFHLFDS